mgnify:CR=1 FL=1
MRTRLRLAFERCDDDTVCGAIKEGIEGPSIASSGSCRRRQGRRRARAPHEIAGWCEQLGRDPQPLVYASRTAAKVDSAAVQDGYQLYHHVFFFTAAGEWCVVQQGMSDETRMARRYHWLSEHVDSFVDEPHEAVCCDARGDTLNLVARENDAVRSASAELAAQRPDVTLDALRRAPGLSHAAPILTMPRRHELFPEMDVATPYLEKILVKTYERAPENFESLLGIEGVGPKTLRGAGAGLELVHGTAATLRDPARFSFAHGGKDGTPYPVDKVTYDKTIEILNKAINRSGDRSIGKGEGVPPPRELRRDSCRGRPSGRPERMIRSIHVRL